MNVLKTGMVVLSIVLIQQVAIPALVTLAIVWQVTVMDVKV